MAYFNTTLIIGWTIPQTYIIFITNFDTLTDVKKYRKWTRNITNLRHSTPAPSKCLHSALENGHSNRLDSLPKQVKKPPSISTVPLIGDLLAMTTIQKINYNNWYKICTTFCINSCLSTHYISICIIPSSITHSVP